MKHLLTTLLIFILPLVSQTQIQIGNDINGEAAFDKSGHSLSMPDSNTIAIGAPFNDGNGSLSGHVRVYSRNNGNNWIQKGVDIDGEAPDDRSGQNISMPNSNIIAIGATSNDGNGTDAGHVRIYRWDGSNWVQKGIDIDGETAGDESGGSVCMPDSNTIAIGATLNDGNGNFSGHVRVFVWNGSNWVKKGTDIDGEAAGDNSGYSVSMPNPNTVAIGAGQNNGNGSFSGHVRVFSWDGNNWIQKGADIDGEAANDRLGSSVSMPDSNTIAVGAPFNNGNGTNSGHVRVYSWNGSAWVQKGIDIDGEASNDYSGSSVIMPDSNIIAIGAIYNDGSGTDAGHVRVYSWNGNAWVQKWRDIDGEAAGNNSGNSVSMPDSNIIAIGATNNNGNGLASGHVRIFCLPPTKTITPVVCDNYTSPSGKYNWTSSGTYQDTIPNATGCDTIITVQLTVHNTTLATLTPVVCKKYTSPSGKYTWTSSGLYIDTLQNALGCDSLIGINLTIDSINILVNTIGDTLIARDTVTTYQWVNCDSNFAAISGATSQQFVANRSGNYAVVLSKHGCTDTSACYNLIINRIANKASKQNNITVYPNPSDGFFTINYPVTNQSKVYLITDINGKPVQEGLLINKQQLIDLSELPTGIYLLRIEDNVVKIVLD